MKPELVRVRFSTPPLTFEVAPTKRLVTVESLAPRCYRDVLDLDYAECSTTDESDLADFTSFGEPVAPELARLRDRMAQHDLVDVRAAQSTRMVAVRGFLQAPGVSAEVCGRTTAR